MPKKKNDFAGEWRGTIQQLAETVADLRYDRMVQFLDCLAVEVHKQSHDAENNILKARLNCAAQHVTSLSHEFRSASKIK